MRLFAASLLFWGGVWPDNAELGTDELEACMKSSVFLVVTVLGSGLLTGCGWFGSGGDTNKDGEPLMEPPAAKVALAPAADHAAQKPVANAPAGKTPGKQEAANIDEDVNGAPDTETDAEAEADEETPAKKKAKRVVAKDDEEVEDDRPRKKKTKKAKADADVFVKRLVIAKGVTGREPTGAATSFEHGAHDRLYAFVEVGNRDQTPTELYVSFFHKESGKSQRVPIKIGAGARWRTWVFTRAAKKAGHWSASVKNAKGKVLASTSFEVTGGATATKSDAATQDVTAANAKAKTGEPKPKSTSTDQPAAKEDTKPAAAKKPEKKTVAAKKPAADKKATPAKNPPKSASDKSGETVDKPPIEKKIEKKTDKPADDESK